MPYSARHDKSQLSNLALNIEAVQAAFGANNEEHGYRRIHAVLARGGEQG